MHCIHLHHQCNANDVLVDYIPAEPTFDRKRHLIGDEFFKQPNSNNPSLVGPSSNPQGSSNSSSSISGSSNFETKNIVTSAVAPEDLTRIPTIVASSKFFFLENEKTLCLMHNELKRGKKSILAGQCALFASKAKA